MFRKGDTQNAAPDSLWAAGLLRIGLELDQWGRINLLSLLAQRACQVTPERKPDPSVDDVIRLRAAFRKQAKFSRPIVIFKQMIALRNIGELVFSRPLTVQDLVAAFAMVLDCYVDIYGPDGGRSVSLSALMLILRGHLPDIIVKSDIDALPIKNTLAALAIEIPALNQIQILCLEDLVDQKQRQSFRETPKRALLVDIFDLLFETGNKYVTRHQSNNDPLNQFVNRALDFAEKVSSNDTFTFDTETLELTLSPQFEQEVEESGLDCFGEWQNPQMRIDAAEVGILAQKCLIIDEHVQIRGDRIAPMTTEVAHLMSKYGERLQAVLLQVHGLENSKNESQYSDRLRQYLDRYDYLCGLSYGRPKMGPFIWRFSKQYYLSLQQTIISLLPGPNFGNKEEHEDEYLFIDWREGSLTSAESLIHLNSEIYATTSARPVYLLGCPPGTQHIHAADILLNSGRKVSWHITQSDLIPEKEEIGQITDNTKKMLESNDSIKLRNQVLSRLLEIDIKQQKQWLRILELEERSRQLLAMTRGRRAE